MVQIIDGLGQVGSRVWPSVADLPAPRLGAFVTVDDGTTGTVYFGCSVGGVAQWVPLPSLLDVIHTVATPTNNQITSSDPTATGLGIATSGPALSAQSPLVAGLFTQPDASAGLPALQVHRAAGTPGTALIEVEFATLEGGALVNGSGETCVSFYSALPAASAYHRGAIIRVSPGAPTADTFWLGALDSSGADVWVQFQGPAGSTGPQGPQPIFGTPVANELSTGSAPTITITGTGTSGDPYIITIGIPAGAQGEPGQFYTPALPGPGAVPITFWLICQPNGSWLPWQIPAGYTVQVVGGWGQWGRTEPSNAQFVSDYQGNSNITSSNTPIDVRYPAGRVLFQTYDQTGVIYANDGVHDYNNGLAALTVADTGSVSALMNIAADSPVIGVMLLQITVAPGAVEGCFNWDFTSSAGAWVETETAGGNGVWVSGTGWQAQLVDLTHAYLLFCIQSPSDFTLNRIKLQGTAFATPIYIDGYPSLDPSTRLFRLGPYALDSGGVLDVTGLSQDIPSGTYLGVYYGPGGVIDITAAALYATPNPYGNNCT